MLDVRLGRRMDVGVKARSLPRPPHFASASRRPAMSFRSGPSLCAHDPDRETRRSADAQRNRCRAPEERLTMTIVITAFDRSPDGGMGLARDTRVRWALEEVGQPYEVRLVSLRARTEPAHLQRHPFGLIPTYEEGDLVLFESGAIVFHIAEHHAGLFPDDADARARAITWMFAAVNTVEPPILELVTVRFAEGDKPWAEERLPLVKDRIRDRLAQLSARLGDAEWLDTAFSAGDLMMVSVLLRLRPSGLLDEFPTLADYVARGEARPAYKRAFAAQLAINAPQAG
jgi:glutathione S-transferase